MFFFEREKTHFFALLILVFQWVLPAQMDKNSDVWEWVEWEIPGVSYEGNPFDVAADVTFRHSASSKEIRTDMFYAGGTSWKFRFTGTREGEWSFTTSSANDKLNGLSGTVGVGPAKPGTHGFILGSGSKFAVQTESDQKIKAFLWNVYQIDTGGKICDAAKFASDTKKHFAEYLSLAKKNGCNGVFLCMANNWFKLGALKSSEHSSTDPDLGTFDLLDTLISMAHRENMFVHFWKWGDKQRRWNQIDVGGINGVPDKRLQRYISARMAPLPGWTLCYGFDLHEWIKKSQLEEWARFMNSKMGWPHLVSIRSYNAPSDIPSIINGYAITDRELGDYYQLTGFPSISQIITDINTDPNRPHAYVERHPLNRYTDADQTRQLRWRMAFAGGVGGWWGCPFGQDPIFSNGTDYPNSDQLECMSIFMNDKARFALDMETQTDITDGVALKSVSLDRFLFYREETSTIRMDLTDLKGGSGKAIAVDTKKAYAEVDLGTISAEEQTLDLPYQSDWALAVGDFEESGAVGTLQADHQLRGIAPTGGRSAQPLDGHFKVYDLQGSVLFTVRDVKEMSALMRSMTGTGAVVVRFEGVNTPGRLHLGIGPKME